jgi:hypothetical protein
LPRPLGGCFHPSLHSPEIAERSSLFLGLLAVPIYFLDLAFTEGGDGNWITLDFRGLIFWTYITLLAIHVALSSIAVLSFSKSGVLRIHFSLMVFSLILLVAGFVVYGKLLRARVISNQQRTLMESPSCVYSLANVGRLRSRG